MGVIPYYFNNLQRDGYRFEVNSATNNSMLQSSYKTIYHPKKTRL